MSNLSAIPNNLKSITEAIKITFAKRPETIKDARIPRLVAVSKKQPHEAIIEAYKAGQRFFGENYIQELVDKATNPEVIEKCPDIKWHFIGHPQKSHVSKIVSIVDKIHILETIDSEKIATYLNSYMTKKEIEKPLNVFVQVNTSGENSKSGVEPEEVVPLVNRIIDSCPLLSFRGLMTIGSIDASVHEDENREFKVLYDLREKIYKEVNLDLIDSFVRTDGLELSMGMSDDFEKAILQGSTNVRVGSKIFGARQY